MASILDRYKVDKKDENKKSSILDKYREQPKREPSPANTMRASAVMEPIDFQGAIDRLPKVERTVSPKKELKGRDIPIIGPVLKGLDWFENTPVQDTIANVGQSFYTPGAGLANVASFVGGVGSKLAQVAPKLTNTLGGRVATEAIKEGSVGVPLAMGQALTQGKDLDEVVKQGALGGVLGAVGGGILPLVGAGASKILNKYRGTKEVQSATPTLELPGPKQRGNVNRAVTDDVITPEYTFKLDQPSDALVNRARNLEESKADMITIDDEIRQLNIRKDEAVNDQFKYLVESMKNRQGIVQGHVEFNDEGKVFNRVGRKSNNPVWFQEWSKANDYKKPNRSELYKLAQKQVEEGYQDTAAFIPSWKEQNNYDETVGTLTGVRNQISKEISNQSNNVTDAIFKTEALGFNPSVKRAKTVLDTTEIKSNSSLPKAGQTTRKDITAEVDNLAKQLDSFDPRDIKDLGGFSAQTRDVYRNLEATMGPNAKPYIEAFDLAKKDNIEMREYWTDRLKIEVVDKLGITKGSKLSGLVQQFGEKRITEDELKKLVPNDWQKVVEADKWFRESYDNMIDIVNESRLKIYPNNPDKIVPKRSDYYRHFRDMEGIAGLKNLFETPSQISPGLSGLSEFVKPKSKFAGYMQKRGFGSFKDDSVGGFLEYIPSASYSTKIDPQIEVFRSLAKSLADTTDESRNVNNLIEYLQDYANNLAGKTNPMDRFVQKVVGRKTLGVVRWVNNRVKTNTILGNVGSLLAQLGNVPNGIAATKQHAIKGAGQTMADVLNRKGAPINQSAFLKERYFNTREFDTRWFEQPQKLAAWAIETADRLGTEFMWNSAMMQGKAQKVADPIAYADDLTRKLVAGRGVGEQPLIQGSAVFQVLAPFTLEVANAWRVMGDFVKKKDIGAIATLFVGSYMFNKVAENVRGSGVVFDPIDAMVDAFQPDLSPVERGGRLVGEVLSNVPFGDKLASVYPEYGGTAFGQELPTREEAFGENDPTRFGGGLTAVKGIQDPLFKLFPPLGGGQIKKTIQGVKAIANEGYEKDDKLRFPIERTPTEIGKAIAFGPNGTSAGREYYDNERRPLSEKQTESYDLLPKDQRDAAYIELMRSRLEDNAKRIMKDEKLTEKERKQKIAALQRKFNELKD